MDWISIGLNIVRENFGVQEAGPIWQRWDESLVQCAMCRGNTATARVLRAHGEATVSCIS